MKAKTQVKEKEISGFLTHEDMEKLKSISMGAPSPHRKKTYTLWACNSGHEFHFKFLKCPVCESSKITKMTKPTLYWFNF